MTFFKTTVAAACITLTLVGCAATTTPEADARFGTAVTTVRAQQTLNPDASRNTKAVTGIDGAAARGALDKYRETFAKETPEPRAPSTVINNGSQ